MELYDAAARQAARQLTLRYSTSFGTASRLFGSTIRDDIYAIYGLVRIADEIVDSYRGADAEQILRQLKAETYEALSRGYSANIIVHAFARTAQRFAIGRDLLEPFFASMAMDLRPRQYSQADYNRYIHGSAEVVGLMCLRVFTGGARGDDDYHALQAGAQALGAAYQKINFLRDLAHDRDVLGRIYFPELKSGRLNETSKRLIIQDIQTDMTTARQYIGRLSPDARAAVATSYRYYDALLAKLRSLPADVIDRYRVRVSNTQKLRILVVAVVRRRLGFG